MPKKIKSDKELAQQLEDFKKQNPKVAQAMELFGITLTKYQETMYALHGPHIYQSNSTARVDKPQ